MASKMQTANIIFEKCEQQVIANWPTVHKSIAILPHRLDSLHVCIQLQIKTQPLSMPKIICKIQVVNLNYWQNAHNGQEFSRQRNEVCRFPYKIQP